MYNMMTILHTAVYDIGKLLKEQIPKVLILGKNFYIVFKWDDRW